VNMPTALPSGTARPAEGDRPSLAGTLRAYFASDYRRAVTTVLGLIWLLDAGLQFQSFMYSNGFIQMLQASEPGQPHWISGSIAWGTRVASDNLSVWNTLFALIELAIALGLLYRPTVKPALILSFLWVLFVWGFGEGLGMLFASTASPLTGAPGAILLYGLIGMIVWPNNRPGGLLSVLAARIAWASVWIVMGYLWLLPANNSANATSDAISAAPSGMNWLTHLMAHASDVTKSNGLLVALILAALSFAIGIAVGIDWQSRTFLWLAIYLNVIYWVIGQGFGGIATGTATDPNAGPLFVLLACAMFPLVSVRSADPTPTPKASPPVNDVHPDR
jgi:hypothetical protein